MNNKKINLIYIASNGRSGSTLLELLLHKVRSFWTMGEISAVSWSLKEKDKKCGCGSKIDNCSFWEKVRNKIGDTLEKRETHPFRTSYGTRDLLRKEIVKVGSNFFSNKNHKLFCKNNYKVFKKIKEIASKASEEEIKYLIDSSKGPYRLWWLNNCSELEVNTIHITKDPRAFIYSMTKNQNFFKKFWFSIRMSFRYVVENRLIKKASGKKYKHIKYEELASNPEKTIKEITKWLGVPYKLIENKINHGVSGNAMRYNFNKVKLDEKWKNNLHPFLKFITILITYHSAKKYGYFK